MQRSRAQAGDLFRPRGQRIAEIELARSSAGEVLRVLGPRLSHERRQRIDQVVAHRTTRISAAVEGVHDPHNTSAVIRTADAFGIQEVHVVEGAIRFRSSRKVTQGAHKWLDVAVWRTATDFVTGMRGAGRRVLVADVDGATELGELEVDRPLVLVFGNESEGISDEMRGLADGSLKIPMFGFVESFNVSVAAAITLATLRGAGRGDLTDEESDILRARFYLRAVRSGLEIVELERVRGTATRS